MSENTKASAAQGGVKRRRFRKLHEYGHHNDIRYLGPISYQGFQLLGWFCIVMSVVALMMRIGVRVNPSIEGRLKTPYEIVELISIFALPFLLISNYARILNNSEGYKVQLLRNGLAMAAIFVVFNVFFSHMVVGTLQLISSDKSQVLPMVMEGLHKANPYGFLCFNIFVDLFLCTVFMYFMNYRPTRVFTGKWIILFRLFAVLPVAYEVASILLKGACARGAVELPAWSFPLLTVKPPMSFAMFMALAIFVKTRELRYCKHGNTHEQYQAFLQTNRNSWHFSVFLAIMLIVASILDFILLFVLLYNEAGSLEALEALDLATVHPAAEAMGFGDAIQLMFVAPLMLLFSYTRKPRGIELGLLIPAMGAALILCVVLQSAYQLVAVANIPPVDFRELETTVHEIFMLMKMQ